MDLFIKFIVEVSSKRDWFDYIQLISSIVSLIILYKEVRNTKKQNKKILYDSKINRLANLSSNIIVYGNDNDNSSNNNDNKSYIEICDNKILNFNEIIKDQNVLEYDDSNFSYNGIKISLLFKSITNIIPTKYQIDNLMLYDTKKNSIINENDILINLKNNYPEFKNIVICDDKFVIIEFYCCVTKEILEKLQKLETEKRNLNLVIELKIKNQFNIINKCMYKCLFSLSRNENKINLSNSKTCFICEKTYEEDNNNLL